jgi:hypothetical protein
MALARTNEAALEHAIRAFVIQFTARPTASDDLVCHDIFRFFFAEVSFLCAFSWPLPFPRH